MRDFVSWLLSIGSIGQTSLMADTLIEHAAERYGLACGDCGAAMVLRTQHSNGKPFWGCSRFPDCRGVHGAHPDGEPMGVPGDKETRHARIDAHRVFDAAWQARGLTKKEAYRWLQEMLDLSDRQAHISRFNVDQCRRLIQRVTLAETVRICALEAESMTEAS